MNSVALKWISLSALFYSALSCSPKVSFSLAEEESTLAPFYGTSLFTYLNDASVFASAGYNKAACTPQANKPYHANGCRRDFTLRVGPDGINTFERLIRSGFRELISIGYPGRVRTLSDAIEYFKPMLDAVKGKNFRISPGFLLDNTIFDFLCRPDFSDCNYAASYLHPANPWALTAPEVWDRVEQWSLLAAKATGSRRVAWDSEYVFWTYRFAPGSTTVCHPFWTDSNLEIIRSHLIRVAGNLKKQGIALLFYHPHVHLPGSACAEKIGKALFKNWNQTPELSETVLFAANPYYDQDLLTWQNEVWDTVASQYRQILGSNVNLSQGFISEFNSNWGWNVTKFIDWWADRPDWDNAWFFTGTDTIRQCDYLQSVHPSADAMITPLECAAFEFHHAITSLGAAKLH